MFVYLVTEKFKRGFAQDVFLQLVFKMMFGVSRGNQDVVDIDKCVRDVA